MRQEDELRETVAMGEWCDERMRCAHGVDDRGVTFVRAIFCNGILWAHELYTCWENAYKGLSKDFGGNITDADLVIYGGCRVS
jgi:hypothetical protein